MSAVEIKSLNKSFKAKSVLNDINLTLEERRIYGLIGNNGVGKNDFNQMHLGLIEANTGAGFCFGRKCLCHEQHGKTENRSRV